MKKQIVNTSNSEKAILIGIVRKTQDTKTTLEYLNELELLTLTAGAITVQKFIQKLEKPNPKTFVGKGKAEEIKDFIITNKIDLVIFDDELSLSQFKNLNKILNCKLLDRSNLILDIFAKRAQTAHAKTQVELAQYQYILPRLTGMWTHLERQKGGIGLRGPGETQIETDRRIILKKISKLKNTLTKISNQKQTQRQHRVKMVKVALIGYTNVGKSSLMNLLTKTNVFAQNKLFATLDTTIKKTIIKNLKFLTTDTVGFIRKLPHHLVESFKSTLDEVKDAHVLIHVVDISHPDFESQIAVVNETLASLDIFNKPIITVFNKIDAFSYIKKDEDDLNKETKENYSLDKIKSMWIAKSNHPSIFVSIKNKKNIDELKTVIYETVKEIHLKIYPNHLLYPD